MYKEVGNERTKGFDSDRLEDVGLQVGKALVFQRYISQMQRSGSYLYRKE